jgi:hypothetical protein
MTQQIDDIALADLRFPIGRWSAFWHKAASTPYLPERPPKDRQRTSRGRSQGLLAVRFHTLSEWLDARGTPSR